MTELTGNLATPVLIGDWVTDALNNPAPLWLLPGFIPAQSLVLLSGRPKLSKKSWWGYLAALSMSTGQATGPFRPNGVSPCLYINKEGADQATAHRFKALEVGHNV